MPRSYESDDSATITCLENAGTDPIGGSSDAFPSLNATSNYRMPSTPMSMMGNPMMMGGMPGMGGMGMGGMGMGGPMNPMNVNEYLATAQTMFDAYVRGHRDAKVEDGWMGNPQSNVMSPTSAINGMPPVPFAPPPSPMFGAMSAMQGPSVMNNYGNSNGYQRVPSPAPPVMESMLLMQQQQQLFTLQAQLARLEKQEAEHDRASDVYYDVTKGSLGNHKICDAHSFEESVAARREMMSAPSVTSTDAEVSRMGNIDRFMIQDAEDLLPAPPARCEWFPTVKSQYVRMNVTTMDRSKRVLPYEKYMRGKEGAAFIAITMYNEPWELLEATLLGVIRNMTYFEERYGTNTRRRIMVALIADGRDKMDKSVVDGLLGHRIIDQQILRPHRPETLHTWTSKIVYRSGGREYGPMNFGVFVKETNGGKLHSHKVLLHGLCPRVTPEYVILLDCGTKPSSTALFKLYDAMERDKTIGGCAGEIEAEPSWCNPIVMSQVFEYKIAHIFDKAAESVMGFISVLPGAFSAYRYRAITEEDVDSGMSPLDKYFDGLETEHGPFRSNIFLAEDRILGFELIGRQGTAYSLRYIPGAIAVTDVPQHVDDLLKQRKRWLNGALFALFYSFMHMKQFLSSNLNVVRKWYIVMELGLLALLMGINLVGVAIYYLLFKFIVFDTLYSRPQDVGLENNAQIGQISAIALNYSFLCVLLIQVIFGLGNSQPTHVKRFYTATMVYLILFQVIVVGMSVFFIISAEIDTITYFCLGTSLYFFGALIHQSRDVFIVVGSFVWYLIMSPLYVIVLPIRAFANIHDISWGTKGLEESNANSRSQSFQKFRSIFLLGWMTVNIGVATIVLTLQGALDGNAFESAMLRWAFLIAAAINLFRFFALAALRLQQKCCVPPRPVHSDEYETVYSDEEPLDQEEWNAAVQAAAEKVVRPDEIQVVVGQRSIDDDDDDVSFDGSETPLCPPHDGSSIPSTSGFDMPNAAYLDVTPRDMMGSSDAGSDAGYKFADDADTPRPHHNNNSAQSRVLRSPRPWQEHGGRSGPAEHEHYDGSEFGSSMGGSDIMTSPNLYVKAPINPNLVFNAGAIPTSTSGGTQISTSTGSNDSLAVQKQRNYQPQPQSHTIPAHDSMNAGSTHSSTASAQNRQQSYIVGPDNTAAVPVHLRPRLQMEESQSLRSQSSLVSPYSGAVISNASLGPRDGASVADNGNGGAVMGQRVFVAK